MSDPRPDPEAPALRVVDGLLARILPERLHRLVRFGIAGLFATGLYFVLMNAIVLGTGTEPVLASVYAYLLALAVSYALQSRFTFRVAQDTFGQVLRFVVTSLAGLAVSYFTMVLVVHSFDLPYIVGAAAICVLIPLTNFFVFKYWVFTPAPVAAAGAKPNQT